MLLAVALGVALAQAAVPAVTVESVEPEVLAAYAAAELTVTGAGFSPQCRVLLGAPGKLLAVPAQVVGDGEIRVRLGLGLGPRPPRRHLVVECNGQRSSPVEVRVERRALMPAPSPAPMAEEEPEDPPAEPAAAEPGVPPVLEDVEPAHLPAAGVETLTLRGSGFAEGAVVRILANQNAGSSLAPEYAIVEFTAEYLSEQVLLVELDRGFAPSPRLRSVVVANPDGGESAPLFLTITRRSP